MNGTDNILPKDKGMYAVNANTNGVSKVDNIDNGAGVNCEVLEINAKEVSPDVLTVFIVLDYKVDEKGHWTDTDIEKVGINLYYTVPKKDFKVQAYDAKESNYDRKEIR